MLAKPLISKLVQSIPVWLAVVAPGLPSKVSCCLPQPHQSNACIVTDIDHEHFQIVLDSSFTSHPLILRYIWNYDIAGHWPTQEDGSSRSQCNTITFARGTDRNSWNTDGNYSLVLSRQEASTTLYYPKNKRTCRPLVVQPDTIQTRR